MQTYDHVNLSLWLATGTAASYSELNRQIKVNVAVIGGGITGLTTALLLKRAGFSVAVIEGNAVGRGVTGYTTGKVTALHTLIYNALTQAYSQEVAHLYAAANSAAIEQVATLVRDLNIDCNFERKHAITYTLDADRVQEIENEVEAANRAGLPVSFVRELDLPFPIAGAIRCENQAQFHAYRYCIGLARAIDGAGCFVFEHSRVTDVEQGKVSTVKTANGSVEAEHVVLATQLPILDQGVLFAKTHPSSSYLMAVRLQPGTTMPQGMYISIGSSQRTMRPALDNQYFIVGGESHKTGQNGDTNRQFEAIEHWVRDNFPVESVDYRWMAHDYMPSDLLPYIGRMPGADGSIFLATGYGKWGLSNGTAAAMLITDLIQGRENPWQALFDPAKINLGQAAGELIRENLNVGVRYFGDRLKAVTSASVETLQPGEGGLVKQDGELVAAYRREDGTVSAVSPVCTHLGCYVAWNSAEKTWDCPCHGSRYDAEGHVLHGPAVHDLEPKAEVLEVTSKTP